MPGVGRRDGRDCPTGVGPGPGQGANISTLRSHIEPIGGQLEVVARFPDGTVKTGDSGDATC